MSEKPKRTAALRDLAGAIHDAKIIGDGSVLVSDVEYDSRRVTPGALFIATVGEKFDGHSFIPSVVEAGAGAIAVQEDHAAQFADLPVPVLILPDCRKALAPISARFWGNPTASLFLAGVTGTNGKTTTSRMIDSIARAAGDTTGVVGTIGVTIAGADEEVPGDRTTPESPDLQRLFARMVEAGCQSAAMEVASHALSQGRVDGCLFDVGVFTNLTQDHLDYHGTMEAYRDAKGLLFTKYADAAHAAGKQFTAVINGEDEAGRHYLRDIYDYHDVLLYGDRRKSSGPCEIAYDTNEVEAAIDSLGFTVTVGWQPYLHALDGSSNDDPPLPVIKFPITVPFGGGFNVQNALAAIGYGVARKLPPDVIAKGLAECPPVPGRFQPVRAGQEFAVLVDYAHTPDGLENVLRSARPLTKGRLVVVFGCGGNRDKTKRPKMGRIALELADIAVVTSDNPRKEVPEDIIDDILAGMTGPGAEVVREGNRRRAIAMAVALALPGDTVVIAGKGHETYQIIGDQTFPFDDVKVAEEEIRLCCAA